MVIKEKKLDCLWALVCKNASVDMDTNSVSLFNVVEELTLDQSEIDKLKKESKSEGVLIKFQTPFELIALWKKRDTKKELPFDVELVFKDPKGETMLKGTHKALIPGDKDRLRVRSLIAALKITTEGDYTITIRVRTEDTDKFIDVLEIPITIKFKKQAPISSHGN